MGNSLKPFKQQPRSMAYEPLISVSENENLRVFSFGDLKKATKKFRQEMVIVGDDHSIRKFYKGYIDEITFAPSRNETGMAVSVMDCGSLRPLEYWKVHWKEQVKSVGEISHPNLVKLLGYCCDDNKSLFLVFEYLHKGSLDCHFYGKEELLPWEIRIKVAIGTAQGLAFIHSIKNSSLYEELSMHNIMLDEQYNAKLLYLESHVQYMEAETRRMGDIIYTPPEPEDCGELKSDVYTFGVILLELLTGSKDTIRNAKRSTSSHDWISPLLSDVHKIGEIVDPRLGNNYHVNAVTQMGTLIRRCTQWSMKKRPSMQQVLDTLNYIAEIKE